jgi:hypothetical protein
VILDLPDIPIRLSSILMLAVFLEYSGAAAALEPAPYQAVYDVYVDGKLRMETRASMAGDGTSWLLRNEGEGIKGLARFLNVSNSDQARVHWSADGIRPQHFSHHAKVAGKEDAWSAEFDWRTATLATEHAEGRSGLALESGTYDPLSLTLAVRQNLAAGLERWEVLVVDEDKLDKHVYAAQPATSLQTALGCLRVIPVERVRENSRRFSTGWYAPSLDFMLVRLQHGKRGDREFDMRIRELAVAGESVSGSGACP